MHENRNLFLFLIEINNMHRTRHILPIPRTGCHETPHRPQIQRYLTLNKQQE